MGDWVFGCDVCQEVCPYNRITPPAACDALQADGGRAAFPLLEWLAMTEDEFRAKFRGTAVMRAKRRGLVRNACVAAGNWREPVAVPLLDYLLSDPEPLVRGHAAWALGRIGGIEARRAIGQAAASEADPWVREELGAAGLACDQESTDCGVPRRWRGVVSGEEAFFNV
jgi:epoxyqueuosine reductase